MLPATEPESEAETDGNKTDMLTVTVSRSRTHWHAHAHALFFLQSRGSRLIRHSFQRILWKKAPGDIVTVHSTLPLTYVRLTELNLSLSWSWSRSRSRTIYLNDRNVRYRRVLHFMSATYSCPHMNRETAHSRLSSRWIYSVAAGHTRSRSRNLIFFKQT
jgi:hypothetical protein